MKKAILELNHEIFVIENDFAEDYNSVIIYEYQNGKAVPIASGSNLKEACNKWIESDWEIDGLAINMEQWARDNNIDMNSIGYAVAFDKYVDSLSGEELFALLAINPQHAFINWKEIESE